MQVAPLEGGDFGATEPAEERKHVGDSPLLAQALALCDCVGAQIRDKLAAAFGPVRISLQFPKRAPLRRVEQSGDLLQGQRPSRVGQAEWTF
jgi:hypothetical protein